MIEDHQYAWVEVVCGRAKCAAVNLSVICVSNYCDDDGDIYLSRRVNIIVEFGCHWKSLKSIYILKAVRNTKYNKTPTESCLFSWTIWKITNRTAEAKLDYVNVIFILIINVDVKVWHLMRVRNRYVCTYSQFLIEILRYPLGIIRLYSKGYNGKCYVWIFVSFILFEICYKWLKRLKFYEGTETDKNFIFAHLIICGFHSDSNIQINMYVCMSNHHL